MAAGQYGEVELGNTVAFHRMAAGEMPGVVGVGCIGMTIPSERVASGDVPDAVAGSAKEQVEVQDGVDGGMV